MILPRGRKKKNNLVNAKKASSYGLWYPRSKLAKKLISLMGNIPCLIWLECNAELRSEQVKSWLICHQVLYSYFSWNEINLKNMSARNLRGLSERMLLETLLYHHSAPWEFFWRNRLKLGRSSSITTAKTKLYQNKSPINWRSPALE